MQFEEIHALLSTRFPDAHIEVSGDGYHYDVLVVSDLFAGLMPVKKQQLVYAALNDRIVDGSLHAVNMKLYTPEQWAQKNA
jgi:acid stress-induced BolA-like protein IbaG/YrbA